MKFGCQESQAVWEEVARIHVIAIDRQPLSKSKSGLAAGCRQHIKVWPRGFGIDVVASYRRNTAPVVYTSLQHESMIIRIQIRGDLNVHTSTQHEACGRNCACDLIRFGFRTTGHP